MTDTTAAVRFYWRPGCGFCSALAYELDRIGLEYEPLNIWEDPDAAGFVRSVAGGNETVPTIAVGAKALVNPAPSQVLAAVAAEAPHLLPS
ncbi:MAG: glutaredoxin domain-containing protein [Acidimicrobiales bacterium]